MFEIADQILITVFGFLMPAFEVFAGGIVALVLAVIMLGAVVYGVIIALTGVYIVWSWIKPKYYRLRYKLGLSNFEYYRYEMPYGDGLRLGLLNLRYDRETNEYQWFSNHQKYESVRTNRLVDYLICSDGDISVFFCVPDYRPPERIKGMIRV